jgi:hypothetical protein
LKDIHDGIVNVSMLFALVGLHTHDDYHITGDGKTPGGFLQILSMINR